MLLVPLNSRKAADINDALFTAPFLRGSNPSLTSGMCAFTHIKEKSTVVQLYPLFLQLPHSM